MLNIGIETLLLTAFVVVALIILFFYIVVMRSETKPEIVSAELKKKSKRKHGKAPKEIEATFLKELPEDLRSAPAEAPERPETAPIETSEVAPVETPQAVPVEPPETVSEFFESPEVAPAEAAKEPGPPGCPYYMGYLRSRPRDSFVPDVCLSCPRILDCLHKK